MANVAQLEHYFRNITVSQEALGQLINTSGRQRMLSQRIAFLILYFLQRKSPETLQSLRETIDQFRQSHRMLTEGDADRGLPGIFSERLDQVFHGKELDGHRKITGFISDAQALYAHLQSGIKPDGVTLKRVLTQASSDFLVLLNKITAAYEEEAKLAAQETQRGIEENQQEIGNLLKAISNVARKANIISINTHIVAGRLGADGKEIRVVAQEIERLTSQIDTLLNEVVEKIDTRSNH